MISRHKSCFCRVDGRESFRHLGGGQLLGQSAQLLLLGHSMCYVLFFCKKPNKTLFFVCCLVFFCVSVPTNHKIHKTQNTRGGSFSSLFWPPPPPNTQKIKSHPNICNTHKTQELFLTFLFLFSRRLPRTKKKKASN